MDKLTPDADWRKDDLRYYKYSYWLKRRFGQKVFKACIDAGFGCPHREGSTGGAGCIFCDRESFTPTQKVKLFSVETQVTKQIARLTYRYPEAAYLAYFQAGTNTHAPVDVLRDVFSQAIVHPKIVGLVVGTRPDCVDASVLDLLGAMAEKTYVAVEYGMQSSHDKSLAWMNRGHDAASLLAAARETRARGVEVGVHIILGIPGESMDDVAVTAQILNSAGINSVKIHNLYVTQNTKLHDMFQAGEVDVMGRDDYMGLLRFFLERLDPSIVVGRLVGEVHPRFLVAPEWMKDKPGFLADFTAYMQQENSWQGLCFEDSEKSTQHP